MKLWTDDRKVAEKLFQKCVIEDARKLGFLVFHDYSSRTQGDGHGKGFCDLVIVGNGRCFFIELKRFRASPSKEQVRWIYQLQRAGQVAFIAQPQDFNKIISLLKGHPESEFLKSKWIDQIVISDDLPF